MRYVLAVLTTIVATLYSITPLYNMHVEAEEIEVIDIRQDVECEEEQDEQFEIIIEPIVETIDEVEQEIIDIHEEPIETPYKVAKEVYDHLIANGYSEVASAAILGNMMNECGGNTLELNPYIYGGSGRYYGLCQWALCYNSKVNGLDITDQLLYLHETIESNMKQFGGSFEEFNSLESPEYAGIYFNKYYERGINSRQRGLNSIVAHEWIRSFE